MTALRAFHGDPKIKAKYLARVKAHRAADELIHGSYWINGKGCAVGCTIHSDQHNAYETELLSSDGWFTMQCQTCFAERSSADLDEAVSRWNRRPAKASVSISGETAP